MATGKVSFAIPQLELVVARNMEKVEWLSRVPNFWQVTILNKVNCRTKNQRVIFTFIARLYLHGCVYGPHMSMSGDLVRSISRLYQDDL